MTSILTLPRSRMLVGTILSTTISVYSFQIMLEIPSILRARISTTLCPERNHLRKNNMYVQRGTSFSSKLYASTHLAKSGSTRNHTTGDLTTFQHIHDKDKEAEAKEDLKSAHNEILGGDTFPFTDLESIHMLNNLEEIVLQTIKEEVCSEHGDNQDNYGCSEEANLGGILVAPTVDPARYFPFTDDESSQELNDLDALILKQIEEEAQVSDLEKLAMKSEHCFPMVQPDTNLLTLWERSRLDASAALNARNGLVTQFTNIARNAPTRNSRKVLEARLLLLGAAALYGTNFPVVKILDQNLPVGACASLRFMMGALVMLPWLLPRSVDACNKQSNRVDDDSNKNICYDWGPTIAGMEVGMWNSVAYIAQAVGLQTVSASKSAFICSLAVVLVPILDALTGKVMSMQKMLGIILAVTGVAFLELGSSVFHMSASGGEVLGYGDLISFLQPIGFGIAFWRLEHAAARYPNDAMRMTAGQLFAVALASMFYCALGTPPSIDELIGWLSDLHILSALLWTGVVTTALTLYMEAIALKTVTAAETTLILSTEPLFGSAFASLLVGERFGPETAVGAFMILTGCLVSTAIEDDDFENKLKP